MCRWPQARSASRLRMKVRLIRFSVRAMGRLTEPSEFDNIILKSGTDGTLVRLKDVGRAELGAENYGSVLRFNGHEAVGLAVTQLPGANALDVDKACESGALELAKNFPPGLKYAVAFDTTTVVGESIQDVLITLLEAIALVIIVIYLFLQDWRSTFHSGDHDPGLAHRDVYFRQAAWLLDQYADAVRHHAGHRVWSLTTRSWSLKMSNGISSKASRSRITPRRWR